MKKIFTLFLTLIIGISVVGCKSGSKNSNATDTITSVAWVEPYSGTKLTFSSNNTMKMENSSGTWSQDENCLTINYSAANGYAVEQYLDIIDDNGNTILKTRKLGKINNSETNFPIEEYYPEDIADEIKASASKKLGDTVSTDIMEITVKKAALAYYAKTASTSTSTGLTANPDEACEPLESKGYFSTYTSQKGRTLVCLDFVLKNTDRGSLNTDNNILSFTVNQGAASATVKGYDLNNKDGSYGLNLFNCPIAFNGNDFMTNKTSNIIIDADETVEVKTVGVVGFEAEDLTAPFELTVALKKSDGTTEQFIYIVE